MKQIIFTLTVLLLTFVVVGGQTLDSTTHSSATIQTDSLTKVSKADPYAGTGDFSPGLAFFALIGLGFVGVYIGVGIVLTVIGLLIVFGLVSVGILSASLIVGLNKKSFAKGFKTFLVLSSSVGGLIICGVGFWLLNKVVHWWTTKTAILIGASCGLLAGIAFGFLGFIILQRLTTFFRKQLNLN